MAKKPVTAPNPGGPIDMSLLSAEDLKLIEEQALKSVENERKDATVAHALEQAKIKARRRHNPKEEMVNVTIDLAEYADRIVIDGTIYMHGHSYNVSRERARVIQETMFRTWGHQAEVDGKKKDFYRKSKDVVLRPVAA